MATAKMQFPVVLKAERPKLTHKSDADAVRLGLTDGAAVAEAFEDFSRRLGAGPALLQRQAGPGAELILGARRDPLFGPMGNLSSSTARPASRRRLQHCGPMSLSNAAPCINIAIFSLMLPIGCMTSFPPITRI